MPRIFGPNGFSLTGPPRSVPLLVRGRILFGGFVSQFGWAFFGFGMVFFWIFALNADLLGWYFFSGELETAKGVVTRSEETRASEGGSEHSEGTPVYKNHYRFTYGEWEYEGSSYATGRRKEAGKAVTIEFPRGDPERSRIRGMRTAVFGPMAALAAIFPAVGLCFIVAGLRKGRKAMRLLVHGKQGVGTLKSKEATGTQMNDQMVYKLTFEFVADDGRTYEAVAKTHQTHELEDDAEEPLLYDPIRPAYATMLDHLPGSPRIDANGSVQTDSAGRSLAVLFLPIISIAGHGIWAYLCCFSS